MEVTAFSVREVMDGRGYVGFDVDFDSRRIVFKSSCNDFPGWDTDTVCELRLTADPISDYGQWCYREIQVNHRAAVGVRQILSPSIYYRLKIEELIEEIATGPKLSITSERLIEYKAQFAAVSKWKFLEDYGRRAVLDHRLDLFLSEKGTDSTGLILNEDAEVIWLENELKLEENTSIAKKMQSIESV